MSVLLKLMCFLCCVFLCYICGWFAVLSWSTVVLGNVVSWSHEVRKYQKACGVSCDKIRRHCTSIQQNSVDIPWSIDNCLGGLVVRRPPWGWQNSDWTPLSLGGPFPGTGIMAADDCQVTTVFTVQQSFHHWHSTNWVFWSVTIINECAVTPHLIVRRQW